MPCAPTHCIGSYMNVQKSPQEAHWLVVTGEAPVETLVFV